MKKVWDYLVKVPMLWVFIAITIIFAFPAIGASAELDRYAVITAIGVDKGQSEGSYDVSLLMFIPIAEQTFTENYKVISSEGNTLTEAINLAGLHVGRKIGLSHIKTIVVNEEVIHEDITNILDFLGKCRNVASSSKLITTNATAKDFLSSVEKLDTDSAIKISELVNYNQDYIYAYDSTIELFFKRMFGPTHTALVPFLKLEEEDSEGLSVAATDSQQSSGGGQSSSGGQGQQENKEVLNDGDAYVFKDGKAIMFLDSDQVEDINLVCGGYKEGSLEIDHFTDDMFNDAKLSFEILNNTVRYRIVYQNDTPIFCIDLSLVLNLSEAVNKDNKIEENIEFKNLPDSMIGAIEKKVREKFANAISIMRDNKADIGNFYTVMYNSDKHKFLKFLESLEDSEDYLNNMVFKMSLKISSQ
ncbi:MAG: hypothetical protein K2K31_01425 [Clostridia bacterium]|nr:hypothetical protein [Clostridia bacterium]